MVGRFSLRLGRRSSSASSQASETSFASQISNDSVDPSARVADELEKLVSEFTEKLRRGGMEHRLSLRRIRYWFSTSTSPSTSSGATSSAPRRGFVTEPVLRCMDVMHNFSEVLTLWYEFKGDELKQRREEKRLKKAVLLAEDRGMSFIQKDRLDGALGRDNAETLILRDHKRQLLIDLYGDMSFFFASCLPEMTKKESIEKKEVIFTKDMSNFECRLLKIILAEDLNIDTNGSDPHHEIENPA